MIWPRVPAAQIEPQASAAGVSVESECQAVSCFYLGDQDRVRQILVILLSNALKFTDRGGSVELALEGAENEVVLPALQLDVAHRDPEYWPDPERFDPERFTPEREKARPRYAYFPFGGGARACIGQYFSMLESIVMTPVLVRAFQFTSPPGDVKLFNGITLRPHQAMPCRIDPI